MDDETTQDAPFDFTPFIVWVSHQLSTTYQVEQEDIEGELWMWVCEDEARAYALAETPPLLRHRLLSVGRRYAAKERAHLLGYDPSDIINYSTRAVRDLLPDVFDHEDWQPSGRPFDGMPKYHSLAHEGMNRVVMLMDIKQAMLKLPEDQYNVIVWVYKYGYSTEQLAAELDITQEAAQKRVQRAVRKIQWLLAEVRPVDLPRRRSVMSNAAARAVQSGHWDGG